MKQLSSEDHLLPLWYLIASMLGSFLVGSKLFLDRKGKNMQFLSWNFYMNSFKKNKWIVNAEFILFTKEAMLFKVFLLLL